MLNMSEQIKKQIKIFRALGEETRYRIVKSLMKGEKCACEIPKLINRTQSNTSMHLAKLQNIGILQSRRKGKMVLYSIKNNSVKNLIKLMDKAK